MCHCGASSMRTASAGLQPRHTPTIPMCLHRCVRRWPWAPLMLLIPLPWAAGGIMG